MMFLNCSSIAFKQLADDLLDIVNLYFFFLADCVDGMLEMQAKIGRHKGGDDFQLDSSSLVTELLQVCGNFWIRSSLQSTFNRHWQILDWKTKTTFLRCKYLVCYFMWFGGLEIICSEHASL